MSTPRVVLHIGPHKTGTTALQEGLRRAMPSLGDFGLSYVSAGLGRSEARIHGQHNLAWIISPNRPVDPLVPGWDAARAEIASRPDLVHIISSERFSRMDEGEVRQVATRLRGFDVRIVYTVRRHLDWFGSAYAHAASHWNPWSVEEWFARRLPLRPHVSHRARVEHWLGVFGRDRLRLCAYEAEKDDLVTPLARAGGLDLPRGAISLARSNAGRSEAHVSLVAAVSRALEGRMEPEAFDRDIATGLNRGAERAAGSRPFRVLLPAGFRDGVRESVQQDVAWLRQHGLALPESYDDTETSGESDITPLAEGMGEAMAASLVAERHDTLSAKRRLRRKPDPALEERIRGLERAADRLKSGERDPALVEASRAYVWGGWSVF